MAVAAQAEQCAQRFRLPLSVVSGRAGPGKTTIIRAIVKGIRQVEGVGAAIHVMTPTGKATDRVRAVFERHKIAGVDVSTIHSFLASNGWLNDNLTFKRWGGKRSDLEGTIVIDETSMLDLALAATFFRSIEWQNRSEEHTSELQSLMRISYAVFCLKKTNKHKKNKTNNNQNNTPETY